MEDPTAQRPLFGMCECGCGQPTNLSPRDGYNGQPVKKGDPLRFVRGHNAAALTRPRGPRLAPAPKACSHCGIVQPPEQFNRGGTNRDGLTSWCKTCTNALAKQIREERPDRYRDHMRRWREQNPERARENERRWARENIERVRESRRKSERNRNAMKKDTSGMSEYVDPLVVLEHHDGTCSICGEDVDPMDFEIEHHIPLSRGGAHAYWNCRPSHPRCNNSKSARMPWELEGAEV